MSALRVKVGAKMPNHFITKRYNRCISVAVNCYQIVINARAWRERVNLDKRVYAGRIQEQKALGHYSKSDCFYSLSSLIKRDKNKRLLAFLAFLTLIALLGVSTAYANPSTEAYKLYAHMKLGSDKQYRCLVDLWTMESHWNPRANNPKSSAYGIPQLLNMKSTNPYVQIDKGLLYIAKRYGLPCKAKEYHSKKGHY